MSKKREIKNEILSIKHISRITKAIEMISVAKLKKFKNLKTSICSYNEKIERIIYQILLKNEKIEHPLLNKRNISNILYIVVSTDRGLVGNLNNNLFNKLIMHKRKLDKRDINTEIIFIGSKAEYFFKNFESKKKFILEEKISLTQLFKPVDNILNNYLKNKIDKIYIASNKLFNNFCFPKISQIVPINLKEKVKSNSKNWNYLYEPNIKKLLDTVLKHYIEIKIFKNIIDNVISEHFSRMIVTKNATENSKNLIKNLQIISNKIRQNNITKELIEIISGTIPIV